MIATNQPYFISAYTSCRCTWTVCQCWSYQQGAYYETPLWGSYVDITPLPKAASNKQRMESLRLKAYRYIPERVRLPMPSIRPSVQALSVRIK